MEHIIVQDLEKSGLKLSEIQQYGVEIFKGTAEDLKKKLGFATQNGQPLLQACKLLEFKYHDREGNYIFSRFRLYPELEGAKYLHPYKTLPKPYILPAVWSVAEKVNKPLWISEGEKKVLKLIKEGRYAISVPGVWNFKAGKDSEASADNKILWEDLTSFRWQGRIVFMGYDMDLWSNAQVRTPLYELALKLMARGAIVKFPAWDVKKGKGIDDLLGCTEDVQKELSGLEDKAKSIEDFVLKEHYAEVVRALKIAGLPQDRKEMLAKPLAKTFGLRVKTFEDSIRPEKMPEPEPKEKYTDDEIKQAEVLLENPDFWSEYLRTCHKTYVERDAELILVKLSSITRHFNRGVSVILTGSSSIGKSTLLEAVLSTIDPEAVEDLSSISEQYLYYSTEPLEHRVVVFYEVAGTNDALNLIKTSLTEGRIVRGTVMKNASGEMVPVKMEKPAAGLVIFSTFARGYIDFELQNRVVLVELNSNPEMRREINENCCEKEYPCIDARIFQIADSLISPAEVFIPYERRLARVFPVGEERFVRDHKKVRTLIMANALLHQKQRDRDDKGRIIATREDYEVVWKIGHLVAQGMSPITEAHLKFLEAIKPLVPERIEHVYYEGLSKRTIIDGLKGQYTESTIAVYISKLKGLGFIVCEGRGSNARISNVILPEKQEYSAIPTIEEIFGQDVTSAIDVRKPKCFSRKYDETDSHCIDCSFYKECGEIAEKQALPVES